LIKYANEFWKICSRNLEIADCSEKRFFRDSFSENKNKIWLFQE